MSTGASLKTIVDGQDKLRQLLDRKAVQALNILGAVTKKEASQSIRRRKRPSKPGEPPSSPTGASSERFSTRSSEKPRPS